MGCIHRRFLRPAIVIPKKTKAQVNLERRIWRQLNELDDKRQEKEEE